MQLARFTIFLILAWGCDRAPTPPEASFASEGQIAGDEELQTEEGDVSTDDTASADEAAEDPAESSSEDMTQPVPAPVVLSAEAIKTLCAGTKLTRIEALNFPIRAGGCGFLLPPNGFPLPGVVTARAIDEQNLALATDEILCDIAITSAANDLTHNDDFYFIMDKYILATDAGPSIMEFDKAGELYIWDFDQILYTAALLPNDKTEYCVGGAGTCVVKEIASPLQVSVTSNQLAPLSFDLIGKDSVKFSVAVTGDVNTNDCQHSALPLSAQISYVKNPNVK
ncbi:MAG: hypothetical protein AB7T49_18515 [Oligoflexales bacterium]